ncbi:PREDICTED: receptor-type tyrosine-protein phosphatase V-like, partial [Leptosomus discolor]|uniref:receptor-type tyrosine-protein phosphatase V-like n=1 Tax=Leptosomus discolor TaxID=188344 RepID=UPI0005227A2F
GEGCNGTARAELEGQDARSGSGTLLNLNVSAHGRPDSLLLSWDEPEGGAKGYLLALSSLESGTLLQNGSAGPNITSFWFRGLTPGMRYEIELTATLACMETTSQTVTAQTSPSPVRNLSLSSGGSSAMLRASWTHAHGQRDGYHLALYHSDSQTLVRNASILPNASTFLFDGLLAGSEYALKVSTLAGSSQASTSIHQWTAPSIPTHLRLSPGSSTSLVASWAGAVGAAWLHLALHNLLTQTVTTTLSARRGLTSYTFQHLHPGTQYWLGGSATAGPYTMGGPNATAWTYPLRPGNVTLSSAEDQSSLQAHWSTPAGERDFYLVTLQEGEDGAPTRNISVGGDNSHVIFHGLSPGKQYSVQVTAVAGPYRASARSTAAWTQPLAPSGVSLSSQGSPYSLLASWEEAMGEGYVLALSPKEHPVKNSLLLRGVTNFTYEGLHPGTLYTFEVSTVAGPYTSSPQRIINWTYPLPLEQLTLSSQGHSTSLQASWRAAPTGSTGYTGTLWETKSQEQVRNLTLGNNWTNVTFKDLVPGRQYTLKMVAMAGPYRSPVRSATDWTYPLAPAGVTLTNTRRPLGLSAFWDKAAGDVDQFHLQLYSKSHPMQRNITVGPNTQNFTFLGLSPGIQYFLKVTVLAGPYRSSSHFATEWTYPLSLANVSVQPGRRPQELHVSWVESGGGRDHLVQLSVAESLSIIRNVSVPRGVTQLDLEGLVPGSRYRVEIISQAGPHRISSQTAIGHTARNLEAGKDSTNVTLARLEPGTCYLVGIWAVAGPYRSLPKNVTGCTVPAAPTNLSLTNPGSSSELYMCWNKPPGRRDSYRVILYSLSTQSRVRVQTLSPDAQNITWTHLEAGSRFAAQVTAVKGLLEASSTNVTQWTHPLAPANLTLSSPSASMLQASWAAAGQGAEGYVVDVYDTASSSRVGRVVLGGDARSHIFRNLSPGTRYSVAVRATAGPFHTSTPNLTHCTRPLPPAAVHWLSMGHPDRLSTSWGAATGGRDGYTLTLYQVWLGTVAATASLRRDTHNFTFMGLTPGYEYSLEASAMAGPYRAAAPNISGWTRPLPPATVRLLSMGHPDRLSASWGAAAGGRDGYTLNLYHARLGTVAAMTSLGRDTHNFTFTGLAPGSKYVLEVVSVAGSHWTPAGNVSNWTCIVAANVSVGKGTSKFTFSGLAPGHKYLLEVVSVAGPYAASAGNISDWTTPSVPQNLSVVAEGNNSMLISWGSVSGQQDDCQLWLRDPRNSTLPWRHTLGRGQVQHLLQGLIPGRNYSVSLSCVAGPYWSSTKPLFVMSIPTSEASLEGLGPNSSYRIVVSTVGMNTMRSQAVTLLCNTTVEALPPPLRADIFQVEASSTVIISSDLFSEENGQIKYYGVIATTNDSLLRPTQEIMSSTWYDHYYGTEDSYLAVLIPNPFHPSPENSPETWRVPVGTEECGQSRATCNGKLKANEQYRFSIAAFTKYDPVAPAVTFTMFSAIFALAYWKHLRAKRTKKSSLPQEMVTYSLRNMHRPIPIQNFKQYYEMKTASANHAFFQEFEELKEVGKEQPKVEAELPANVSKNRYPHVLPYDHSRVKLSRLGEDPHSEYINANFMPGYTSQQEFIATQGPLKKTIDDFWRLVWEQNVCNIIMLTVCMENGRVLCDHYWPSESAPVSYGQVQVHLLMQSSSEEWTMREFKLWHEGLQAERHVSHLHYTAWPDHGIPESTTSIMTFRELVREQIQSTKDAGPTLVHCSAGVGRTGTFIALDQLLQQMKQEKVVDTFGVVYALRMNRYLMIQTLSQYIFLHSCILEKILEEPLLGLSGTERSCPIPLKSFAQHYTQKAAKSHVGFLREYETLLEVIKEEASSATPSSGNQQTRPSSSILPYDRSRVKFSLLEQGPFSGLLQVWHVPGCSSSREYLAVQGPDKLTMEDFWTLVWDQDIHTILTLLPCQEKGEVPSEACWPLEGDSLCTKMLTIQCCTEKLVSGWRCIQLKMRHEKKAKERQVQQFLYTLWSSKKQPDVQSLVELLTVVRRCMPHRKRGSPLLLHCSGGVSQMGTLISLDCLLHQMKSERIVDVYGVTLQLTRSCCLMTPTLDQYIFLYTCIQDIITQKQP